MGGSFDYLQSEFKEFWLMTKSLREINFLENFFLIFRILWPGGNQVKILKFKILSLRYSFKIKLADISTQMKSFRSLNTEKYLLSTKIDKSEF